MPIMCTMSLDAGLELKGNAPAKPQMMHLPPKVPKLQSSQMRTIVSGRTYESQTGLSNWYMLYHTEATKTKDETKTHHLPSHFSQSFPVAAW